jgi:plasmid stability protein
MASLVVRNLDERIVQALKARAARHGCSAEAEHRALLEAALLKTCRRNLAAVLSAMPDAGRDEDFERIEEPESPRVFD